MEDINEKPEDFAVISFVSVGSGAMLLTGGLPIACHVQPCLIFLIWLLLINDFFLFLN